MFCVIEKALQKGELVLLQFEESSTSAYCGHGLVILTSHPHMNDLDEYTQHI